MTSVSLTWSVELNGDPCRSDTTPFPGENTVMMAYGGHPSLGRHHRSNLSRRAPTHYGWGHRSSRV
jgi:hypothetical protein